MNIVEGLSDGAVLQRNRNNQCDIRLAITSEIPSGRLEWRSEAENSWKTAGKILRGKAQGRLKGLPAGGPYVLELRALDRKGDARETLTFKDLWVGDIWVLAGQSNMQGSGLLRHRLPPMPAIRAFYADGAWAPAEDPIHAAYENGLHSIGDAGQLPEDAGGVGPGVAMAQALWDATGIPQGLIPCAKGGTTMKQWDPKRQHQKGSLYGKMLERIRVCGGRVAGLAWYQGENEATPAAAGEYTRNMQRLIASFRQDAAGANAPVVIAQLSRVAGWEASVDPFWTSIREQQRRLSESVRNLSVISTLDATFDDPIHVGALSGHRIGKRMAMALEALQNPRSKKGTPIQLASVQTVKAPRGLCDIIVRFRNVTGRLCTAGDRPHGFCLADPELFWGVFKIDLHEQHVVLHTRLTMQEAESMSLFYGYGLDPYCNLVDEVDHAVPGFGPVALGKPNAMTAYARSFRISGFEAADGRLQSLRCPDPHRQDWEWTQFPDRMANRMEAIAATKGQTGAFFYACRLTCKEPMRLDALIGYDGPVKVWVNRKEVFHDPEGTNPASPADARIPFDVPEGRHEVVVALGNNDGNAWGIYLRFERLDLALKRIHPDRLPHQLPTLSA